MIPDTNLDAACVMTTFIINQLRALGIPEDSTDEAVFGRMVEEHLKIIENLNENGYVIQKVERE